tara:strand:+ start:3519 stop:3788 length:270 start_codon:yes stop_codon:yes gene_type:complete
MRKPNVLSNRKVKKTASLAMSLSLNKAPKIFIHKNLTRKKRETRLATYATPKRLITILNFAIINVKFTTINKKVSKLTLSVNALSSLKY